MPSREALIAAAKPKIKVVKISEWKNEKGEPIEFTIRELSADTLLRLGKDSREPGIDEILASAREIIHSVVEDEDTSKLAFAESDIPMLLSFGSAGILRLRREINDLNGLGKDQVKN